MLVLYSNVDDNSNLIPRSIPGTSSKLQIACSRDSGKGKGNLNRACF